MSIPIRGSKDEPVLPYWDRLQQLIDVCRALQASPIPGSEIKQEISLMRLGQAEYELHQMLAACPHVHIPPVQEEQVTAPEERMINFQSRKKILQKQAGLVAEIRLLGERRPEHVSTVDTYVPLPEYGVALWMYSAGPPLAGYPKWTIVYNTIGAGSDWIGTGREFFDEEKAAERRYYAIPVDGATAGPGYSGPVCATKRPFHEIDIRHLGAAHR